MMIKRINLFLSQSALIKGSFIVLMGSVLTNLASYLYHLSMGRLLGPNDYGILESLISILYFLGIPVGILNLVVVKFVSQQNKNKEKISFFLKYIIRLSSFYGFLGLVIFLLMFPFLKNLVRIDSFLLFAGLGISSYIGIFSSVFSGTLQGIMKFLDYTIVSLITNWSRFIFAVILVLFGLKVNGAVTALILSSLVTLLFSYRIIRKYISFDYKGSFDVKDSSENIRNYSLAIFFSNLSLMSFFTVDIILARYFLSPVMAGQYASLSVLGKIIFFASSPIVSVMFPMISEKKAAGNDYLKLMWSCFLMVSIISLIICAIYFIFPQIMVKVLFGEKYLQAAANLGLFGVFISLYSLCSLLSYFYLSISQTKIIYLGVIFAAAQIIFINFYHSSIHQIVMVNIGTLSLFLAGLLIYYLHLTKKAVFTKKSL